MPNLPWPGSWVYQLSLLGVCDTSAIVNVFHFASAAGYPTGTPTDADMVTDAGALADDFVTKIKPSWVACHSNDYTLQMVRCQVIEKNGAFRHKLTTVERPQSTANVGTIPQGSEATQVAAVVRWRSAIASKSCRGRTYVGPVSARDLSSGQVGIQLTPLLTTWRDAMLGAYSGAGTSAAKWFLIVYSRPYNSGEYQYASRKTGTLTVVTPPDYAGAMTGIIAGQIDSVLRTQRRREYGVGS